jgi:hypothetical protein
MPVTVSWDDQQHTTLRFDYNGNWTWEEWYAAMDEAEATINLHGDAVHFIHNVGDSMYLPKNAMTNFKQNAIHFHAMVRLTVIVSDNHFIKVMFNTFKRFVRDWASRYHYVATVGEARQIILDDTGEFQL